MRHSPILLAVLALAFAGCAAAERIANDAMNGIDAPPMTTVTDGDWSTHVPSTERQDFGRRYTVDCPSNPQRHGIRTTHGSGPYHVNGSICGMGVHAGVISFERGGRVTVEVVRGQNRYVGSERNGMRTENWNSASQSSLAVVGS